METFTLTRDELKDLVHESVEETLSGILFDDRKRSKFLELLEDHCLGRLMEEGMTGNKVSESEVMKEISRIRNG